MQKEMAKRCQSHDIRYPVQSDAIITDKTYVRTIQKVSPYTSEMMTQDSLAWLQVVRDFLGQKELHLMTKTNHIRVVQPVTRRHRGKQLPS